MSREHYWPQWLIARTGADRTAVRWVAGKVNPRAATLPLCVRCNSEFGAELEGPMARLFEEIEGGRGLSDEDAELFVRWLWKFEGLARIFGYPQGLYSQRCTLRERVLRPINDIRGKLILAVALIEKIEPEFGDAPLGIDSWNEVNAIFVAGVFSRIAVMVLHEHFEDQVPPEFSKYRLFEKRGPASQAKLFYPKVGFKTCVEAVGTMAFLGGYLSMLHDRAGEELDAFV